MSYLMRLIREKRRGFLLLKFYHTKIFFLFPVLNSKKARNYSHGGGGVKYVNIPHVKRVRHHLTLFDTDLQ